MTEGEAGTLLKALIIPPGSAPSLAPYSPDARAGKAIHVPGVPPLDVNGVSAGSNDAAQTRAVLNAAGPVAAAGGGPPTDGGVSAMLLENSADFAAMNADAPSASRRSSRPRAGASRRHR
jgi:aminoacrylate peracid reductase